MGHGLWLFELRKKSATWQLVFVSLKLLWNGSTLLRFACTSVLQLISLKLGDWFCQGGFFLLLLFLYKKLNIRSSSFVSESPANPSFVLFLYAFEGRNIACEIRQSSVNQSWAEGWVLHYSKHPIRIAGLCTTYFLPLKLTIKFVEPLHAVNLPST